MKNFIKYFFGIGSIVSVLITAWSVGKPAGNSYYRPDTETMPPDSDSLRYPFRDHYADPYSEPQHENPMYMQTPSNIKTNVEYDPAENQYNINQNMGTLFYRNPSYMSFDEFVNHEFKKSTRDYWMQRAGEDDKMKKKAFAPKIHINSVIFDRIFGGNTIDIRPQGSAELIFAANISNQKNPALPENQRKVTTFDFKEKIQMNVIANIGDKLKLQTNYNTEATFDFENKMKLEYTGYEDDIIKKIEAGNVTLPLNSQLIQGSQSLFGIKTELQFGRLKVTSIFSQQKGKSSTIDVQGGAQTQTFDIKADQYEANKHFFLAQYFKDNYDYSLRDLNHVNSSVNITRCEVWVTTIGSATQINRNLVAFADLGEYHYDSLQSLINASDPAHIAPDNYSNNIFAAIGASNDSLLRSIANVNHVLGQFSIQGFKAQRNYESVSQARLLSPNEYTLNGQLGFISLNVALNPNQVLAVAYEYTVNGQTYHVGELTTSGIVSGNNALFVKLIKGTQVNPRFYTWDLMMKNIYSLGAYNIQQKDFRLDVVYQDDRIGTYVNYIPDGCATVKGIPLITLFNLDQLNTNGDPQPDGVFDIKPGITINLQNGKVIFPVREPFGTYLRSKFCPSDAVLADQYAYDALYDSTKTIAQQQPEKNKFSIKGKYQSSGGSDIPLNAVNIPPGSVKVTAGGATLVENVDYTVDYNLGRVKILNDQILKSNTPIKINLESNSLFNLQTKTMIGSRFDYYINKDFTVGGTFLHLSEKPLTQKVNIGDEPISNTVWGVDGTYRTESRFLTKMLDALPFYNTKEISTITVSGEFAQLIPGHSSAIGSAGTSYVDDFEGAITPLDIKNPGSWYLASVPQGQADLFPEGDSDSLLEGFNRAKVAWYYIDPLFQHEITNLTPSNITSDDRSNNYVREVPQAEIFPNKSQPNGPTTITCMNLAYYPDERGPYNYVVDSIPSLGIDGVLANGHLKSPQKRWGGIMRKIETSDFEASNIEFIQFWMMNPFASNTPNTTYHGGDLYFNLGTISEDILRDGQKSFENGLPASTNNYTAGVSQWGRYPMNTAIVSAFDNDQTSRAQQDVGLDGLSDNDEVTFFNASYLAKLAAKFGTSSAVYQNAAADPSSDDYSYYQSNTYNSNDTKPLERYKKYNGTEGNSPAPPEVNGYNATATNIPDVEDINRDNNMEINEAYYQYKVHIGTHNAIGQNYLTDSIQSTVQYANGTTGVVTWYQYKIPILQPTKVVNGIENFNSIQFIRMFLKGFDAPVVCRFAKLEFLRGEWRKYNASLLQPGEYSPTPEVPGNTIFDVSSVSIEENGNREPIPYVLPPGIDKERDISVQQLATLNEQSLSLRVCNLQDGDARAAFKTTQVDIRSYKKLKMFIHAESLKGSDALSYGDLTCFIRLGSDFSDNYYEYEIPLTITAPGSISPYDIWPEANNMEIVLDNLVNAKLARNNAMLSNHAINLLTPFSIADGTRKITIKGTPNLSNVRAMMIGIRNPKSPTGSGAKLCGEVWVNELRLSDFDEKGGWAATARVTAKLADLGTMTLVGNHSTAGWGSIEKRVSERDKVNKTSYDFSTSIELGKFLPEKSGMKIPMFFGYSETFIDPQYNPLDPDVLFQTSLDAAPNSHVRDSITHAAQDYTQRKSINFTNVKKTKTGKNQKAHIYDVENLNFTYAYTEQYQRNPDIEYSSARTHQAIIGYNYNASPKPISPFTKVKALDAPYLKLVKDFNFNLLPSQLSFQASLERTYAETQIRDNSGLGFHMAPTFAKTYKMTRVYGLKHDLTKSLKLEFDARAEAAIDEPQGRIDTREERDSIIRNLKDLGRLKDYHQATKISYTLPLSKIPLVDWITATPSYTGTYSWIAGPLAFDTANNQYAVNKAVANTISNSQSIGLASNLNMVSLYNKIPYLKKINQDANKPKPEKQPKLPKVPKSPGDVLIDSALKTTPSPLEPYFKGFVSVLMSVKTIGFNYTETNAITMPGFYGTPDFLGNDFNYKYPHSGAGAPSSTAPGWGFVFGSQHDPRADAARYQWLTNDTSLNATYITSEMRNFSGRASVEPFKNFKIELTATRNFSLVHNEYYKANSEGVYSSFSPTESGNFSMSYLSINTAFVNDRGDYSNSTFDKFGEYRRQFSQILSAKNPNAPGTLDTAGYFSGYNATQQEVLTYAFLAAYSGKTPASSQVNQFPKIPLPNWRITYDGISKMKWAQKYFQSVSITHGYRSMYSINSFVLNLDYKPDKSGRDTIRNFIPQYSISQVTIAEQFAPLLGIEMTFKNSLQARFEYKRDRTVTLSYSNIQVTEIRGTEYTVGLGYKIKKFTLPFIRSGGGKKKLSNDLNLKADFTLRDNKTIIRKLVENTNQPSAGTQNISYKLSADYAVNERFNVKAFYDTTINNPFVSSSYPSSNVNAGISIRFTLAQ